MPSGAVAPILFEVLILLIFHSPSGGYDVAAFATINISNLQQNSIDHANGNEPIFIIGETVIELFDHETIRKNESRPLETHTVPGQVLGVLDVVPLEVVITQIGTA